MHQILQINLEQSMHSYIDDGQSVCAMGSSVLKHSIVESLTGWGKSSQGQLIKVQSKREEMISFYEEEKKARKELHRKEKENKVKGYEKMLKNLKYLLELQQQKNRKLISLMLDTEDNTSKRGRLQTAEDDIQFSLRISMDSDLLDIDC